MLIKWLMGSHAQQIETAQFRADFVKSSIESCLKVQTKAPENKDLTVGQLTTYCTCMATAEVNDFKLEDYKAVDQNHAVPESIQKRIDAMAPACVDKIVQDLKTK